MKFIVKENKKLKEAYDPSTEYPEWETLKDKLPDGVKSFVDRILQGKVKGTLSEHKIHGYALALYDAGILSEEEQNLLDEIMYVGWKEPVNESLANEDIPNDLREYAKELGIPENREYYNVYFKDKKPPHREGMILYLPVNDDDVEKVFETSTMAQRADFDHAEKVDLKSLLRTWKNRNDAMGGRKSAFGEELQVCKDNDIELYPEMVWKLADDFFDRCKIAADEMDYSTPSKINNLGDTADSVIAEFRNLSTMANDIADKLSQNKDKLNENFMNDDDTI